jgi:hypothetical protein
MGEAVIKRQGIQLDDPGVEGGSPKEVQELLEDFLGDNSRTDLGGSVGSSAVGFSQSEVIHHHPFHGKRDEGFQFVGEDLFYLVVVGEREVQKVYGYPAAREGGDDGVRSEAVFLEEGAYECREFFGRRLSDGLLIKTYQIDPTKRFLQEDRLHGMGTDV